MSGLERFNFHRAEVPAGEVEETPAFRGMRAPQADGVEAGFSSDEAAARFHLNQILERDDRPAMRGVMAPERAELVPDLQLTGVQDLPGTETRLVRFDQTKEKIPVFGGHVVCELNADRGLVSANGEVAGVSDVSTIATVSQADALKGLAEQLGVDAAQLASVRAPELQLFADEGGKWHLIWLFASVPAAPKGEEPAPEGHGIGRSPRDLNPRFDYLVDAHDGSLVYYYSSAPTVTAPTYGSGDDENDVEMRFLGQMSAGVFEMRDPLRNVSTYDHQFGDIENPALTSPIQDADGKLGNTNKAAVSAHCNASAVDDFYRGVLQRNGIDDKGMDLVNVINCTYAQGEPPPEWHNAVWWEDRMWYGQAKGSDGVTRSFSRFLDVIAHELTHGVTQNTANLVYRDESGALNESYSDILGIIVKNWDPQQPADGGDVSGWDWEIGSGLGAGGGPIRDMSNPAATGDPAHMSEYLHTNRDSGGVHTNSNIHNKAAYNVLTATEADGSRAFTPRECAYLFYIGLSRLGRQSGFGDSLTAVTDVAKSLWGGDPQVRDRKVEAIERAYAEVGIT